MLCSSSCSDACLPDVSHLSGKTSFRQPRGASHVSILSGAGEPDGDLVRVLRRYAGKLPWAASMFQPTISKAPALLLVSLEAHAQDGETPGGAGDSLGSISPASGVPDSSSADVKRQSIASMQRSCCAARYCMCGLHAVKRGVLIYKDQTG